MIEPKRSARTESLSLRIDPKTKFVLEFLVRLTGFRITDLIEQAIKDFAETKTVGNNFDGEKNWSHYWHPDEGFRTINLIFDKDIRTSFQEDELREFIKMHYNFFCHDKECKRPLLAFIEVLWPKIDEYLDHWRNNKSAARWATGTLMMQAINSAGMRGFEWPPAPSSPAFVPTTSKKAVTAQGIDDEIPF